MVKKLIPNRQGFSEQPQSIEQMRETLKEIQIRAEWSIGEQDFAPVLFTHDDIIDTHKFYVEPIYGW